MKKLFTIVVLFLLFSISTFAEDTLVTYIRVIEIPNTKKEVLYDRARLWSIDAFKRVKGAMQVEDRNAGILAFDGNVQAFPMRAKKKGKDSTMQMLEFHIKMKIQFKDNKYKVEIADIKFQPNPYMGNGIEYPLTSSNVCPWQIWLRTQQQMDRDWTFVKEQADKTFNELLNTLNSYIDSKKDDF